MMSLPASFREKETVPEITCERFMRTGPVVLAPKIRGKGSMVGAREEIAKLTVPKRIEAAKAKTEKVVDHLRYLIKLHENNVLILSPLLRSQIPTSHAGNAFIVFQHGVFQFEIVRLCALWDGIDLDKENVPTIIAFINQSDVVDALVEESCSPWPDPHDKGYRAKIAQKARAGLHKAIRDARKIEGCKTLKSIMNLRHKHLAHSLTQTRDEKAGSIPPMKYGDQRVILNKTLPIVQALHLWINGADFSFNKSRKIDRKNAKALWEGCKFTIEY
jgi:AbiU2